MKEPIAMDCQHEIETQVVHLAAFLRSELGYHADGPGAVQRELLEHTNMIASIDDTLRGRGDELGLVGWMMVLRRTWITMVALLGMALGYVVNDVVDAIGSSKENNMQIRDRILELRRVPARELRPNPRNWRTHPEGQREALRGLLAEVGYAGALLARELEDGSLQLIDGHLRAETTPEAIVPVLVLDVNAAEADKILLTHDSVAALAVPDHEQLAALLAEVEFISPEVEELLHGLTQIAVETEGEYSPERADVAIPESWQVVVECRDEADQREVFERMRGEGRRCRVLSL